MALATSNQTDYRHFYKLLLVGDSGVGKSCLLTRFADSTFNESRTSTIGVDFKIRTVEIDDTRIKLQVWDSAGQERFRTVSDAYYRGAHGIGVVFDVTNEKSFRNLESWWLKEVENNKCGDVPRVLIGTKCDLADARKVRRDEVELFSRRHGMQYIETSSKTAERVSEAFMAIAREVYEARYVIANWGVLMRRGISGKGWMNAMSTTNRWDYVLRFLKRTTENVVIDRIRQHSSTNRVPGMEGASMLLSI